MSYIKVSDEKELWNGLKLHNFIGSSLVVCVSETRYLKGLLIATDCKLNLLLDKVKEINHGMERNLGLVSIPIESIISISMERAHMNSLLDMRREILRDII